VAKSNESDDATSVASIPRIDVSEEEGMFVQIDGLDSENAVAVDETPHSPDDDVAFCVEELGHLTRQQTEGILMSMPDDFDQDSGSGGANTLGLDEAIQDASTEQYRDHRIFRHEVNAMSGRIGRVSTNLCFFSNKYISLEEMYKVVTTPLDMTADEIMDTLLSHLATKFHSKQLPPHWRSADGNTCIFCNEVLESDKGYSHVLRCSRKDARSRAEFEWDTYLAGLPTKCSWTSMNHKKSTTCKTDLTHASAATR
jgi:hypothetical protein